MIGLMVGGTASGVGKTTVALALVACLRKRGYAVQPFKGGPDFLDTTHLSRIAGRTARNLDTWMLDEAANHAVLQQAAAGADAVVVEGMMGLFDGKDGLKETGSSAEIAKLLQLPVLLVVDCAKSARSAAATVLGFETFDPALPLAGLILNRVASASHYRLLATAIEHRCKTPILGWLPADRNIAIPERHLGLHAAQQIASLADADQRDREIDALARLAEEHFQVDALLRLQCPVPTAFAPKSMGLSMSRVRLGVARDAAFSFYYEDNLEMLREEGAELIAFSPMADAALPPDLDGLYLGGGYPELYVRALSHNRSMLEQVRAFAKTGAPIYAECGGLLYLSQQLRILDGSTFPLTGVLPLATEMTERLVDFGYVTVTFSQDCVLGPKGTVVRGHSFHYSRICGETALGTCYEVDFSLSRKHQQEGFGEGSVLGSYAHLHFRANPAVARHFVAALRVYRQATQQIAGVSA